MVLTIAVSHVDLTQAFRQMCWLGFLSEKNGNSMLNHRLLLVVSRRASRYEKFKQLTWLAARIFGEARCFVPDNEHEVGWPGAANFMFKTSLEHVRDNFHDDVFFLEPDGIPIGPDWFEWMNREWVRARDLGKFFMGAYVPHTPAHMTGIAVYSKAWPKVAPSLVTCPDHDAFDTWSAPEVMPNCHFIREIQHVFRRHDKGWVVPHIGILDQRAVLFHQDKKGRLIYMLDHVNFGEECRRHTLFGYEHLDVEATAMRKFYSAANVTKAIVAHDKRFLFEALDCHGGSVPGAYSTEVQSEQDALADLTTNPGTGVQEISKDEWENLTKKKAPAQQSTSTSRPSNSILPQAALLPTPSNSPAVLVAEAGSGGSKHSVPGSQGPIEDIADVIKLDTVEPARLATIGTKLPRPEHGKKFNLNREGATK